MEESSANPFDRVVGPWEAVIRDMEATAARYRDDGHTVIELHPGDVTLATGAFGAASDGEASAAPDPARLGFDVVVPGDEFERLQSALADRTIDEYEVFRATGNGMAFLLLALESGDLVVLVPAYYDLDERDALERLAREHGLRTHVRPLTSEAVVTVEHADPEPFFPE